MADPKFKDPILVKTFNDQVEPRLLKLSFVSRSVMNDFLGTISPIYSEQRITRLKIINRYLQRFISKTNPFLVDLIKPSDAGLTAKHSVMRLLAANCLRAAGNNSEDIQKVYMSAGIDDLNAENLPHTIFLSEANQIEFINEHLVKGFNSLPALSILERVSNWGGRAMVLIKLALDNPNFEVRYRAARLIASNAAAFPADKIMALPFLIEAIGNEKVDQKSLRLLLKEPLSAGLLSKDAKSILTIRRKQFPDFFSKLGVRIDMKGFDATFAVLDIMGHKWDGLAVGRIFVDHLMSILGNPKSGLLSDVYKQFVETPISFLDKKKFEDLLSTTSSDNVRFYTALLLHKKWKIWNSQIEKAIIPFFESDLVPDHSFSLEALRPILDLMENGIEQLPIHKRNKILKMLSVAPLDLLTIDRLINIAKSSKNETEIAFILGRNEFSKMNNEVNLFLNNRANDSEIARFSNFLESKDLIVRFSAARNLALLRYHSDLVLSILIEGLISQYSDLRQEAIWAFKRNSFQIKRNEMEALMKDFLNPLSKSRLLSQEVLGLQQALPSDIKANLEKLYPGYSYQEVLGIHRFKTPRSRTECLKFYQK